MEVGALVVLPLAVFEAQGALTDPHLLGAAFIVAIASSVLPYSLELEALRRLPESVFGILMSLDPAFAALVGFLALGQVLSPRDLLAIAMVVVASAGAAALSHR
jgi:inner membrane transporter RhtA